MNPKKKISRRHFLKITGLTTLAGGITCAGSLLGYLTLKRLLRPPSTPATPISIATRSTQLKQIDRPLITLRADWNARAPNHEAQNEPGFYSLTNVEGWRIYENDLRAIYRTVVVHHSVILKSNAMATMCDIQDQHMDTRKWADIGYHFGVGRNGQIFEGRDLMARGTHVERFNTGSVGVVFFGNFERTRPFSIQIEEGRRLIDWLALRLELTHLARHGDFNDFTDCPGKHMYPYIAMLASSAGLMLGTGGYQAPPEQLITPTPASAT